MDLVAGLAPLDVLAADENDLLQFLVGRLVDRRPTARRPDATARGPPPGAPAVPGLRTARPASAATARGRTARCRVACGPAAARACWGWSARNFASDSWASCKGLSRPRPGPPPHRSGDGQFVVDGVCDVRDAEISVAHGDGRSVESYGRPRHASCRAAVRRTVARISAAIRIGLRSRAADRTGSDAYDVARLSLQSFAVRLAGWAFISWRIRATNSSNEGSCRNWPSTWPASSTARNKAAGMLSPG